MIRGVYHTNNEANRVVVDRKTKERTSSSFGNEGAQQLYQPLAMRLYMSVVNDSVRDDLQYL
jgi:hypothetical protein